MFVALLASLMLAACGAATNSPIPTSTPAPVNLSNGSIVTRGGQSIDPPVFYDPAIRFGAWGSADPALKATPASARACVFTSGSVDQLVGGFKLYANNCVMSYQVSQARFDQMISEGNFFATDLLEKFSLAFKDEFDFIVLSLDPADAQPIASFAYAGQYQSLGTRLPKRIRRLMGLLRCS